MNRPQLVLSKTSGFDTARARTARLEAEIAAFRLTNETDIARILAQFVQVPRLFRALRVWEHAPAIRYREGFCAEAMKYEHRVGEIVVLIDAHELRRAGNRMMELMTDIQDEAMGYLDDHDIGDDPITEREAKAIHLKAIYDQLGDAHLALMQEIFPLPKPR